MLLICEWVHSGSGPAVALNSWGCARKVDETGASFLMGSGQAHFACVSPGHWWGRGQRGERKDRIG